jgi:hypothetical protein
MTYSDMKDLGEVLANAMKDVDVQTALSVLRGSKEEHQKLYLNVVDLVEQKLEELGYTEEQIRRFTEQYQLMLPSQEALMRTVIEDLIKKAIDEVTQETISKYRYAQEDPDRDGYGLSIAHFALDEDIFTEKELPHRVFDAAALTIHKLRILKSRIVSVLDDNSLRILGNSALCAPSHALTCKSVIGEAVGDSLLELVADLALAHVALDAFLFNELCDDLYAVVSISSKLVRCLVLVLFLVSLNELLCSVIACISSEWCKQHYALCKRLVEVINAEDTVKSVAAEELR